MKLTPPDAVPQGGPCEPPVHSTPSASYRRSLRGRISERGCDGGRFYRSRRRAGRRFKTPNLFISGRSFFDVSCCAKCAKLCGDSALPVTCVLQTLGETKGKKAFKTRRLFDDRCVECGYAHLLSLLCSFGGSARPW